MGVDKALLVYEGEPQVRRVAGMLERIAPPVYVSVRRAQVSNQAFAGMRLLPDQEEGVGPLEGLLSAFRESDACAWLVVAVDMPFLSQAAVQRLVESRDPISSPPRIATRPPTAPSRCAQSTSRASSLCS